MPKNATKLTAAIILAALALTLTPVAQAATSIEILAAQKQAETARAKLNQGAIAYFRDKGAVAAVKVLTDRSSTKYLDSVQAGSQNSATNISLLLRSINILDEANAKRATEGLPPLQMSDTITAISIVDADWSANHIKHSKQYNSAENLGWAWDITDNVVYRWWDKEKVRFEQHATKDARLQSIRHDAYEVAKGWPTVYYGVAGQEQETQTGHYVTMSDSTIQYAGTAISHLGRQYPYVMALNMHNQLQVRSNSNGANLNLGRTMTATAFRADLTNWVNTQNTIISKAENMGPADDSQQDPNSQPVHRLYNPNHGLHHYTASDTETVSLINSGWRYEGVSFTQSKTGTPVYRAYDPRTGNHHWTASQREYQVLTWKRGWRGEGVGWYTSGAGSVNVWRAYNPRNGEHLYTTSETEYRTVTSRGWRGEGVAWKAMK
ncbi:hypothetical protein [Bifidobacterium callitrichidarum]|uniref:DUF5648 domain-containing protein n=1 Tax=Bifidobacterium callitrichidarum TaxID=2052941 RepID=A0A2U2N993_9BIFI|nr:hypothetical protein [Bifidobacterium callitrichidarum]PWG65650.1 hypothetical protein DF196_06875 [Bifidobacterium callitrichidarum]